MRIPPQPDRRRAAGTFVYPLHEISANLATSVLKSNRARAEKHIRTDTFFIAHGFVPLNAVLTSGPDLTRSPNVEYHVPVLAQQTVDLLVTDTHGAYLDLTLGGGGHAKLIHERLEDGGKLIGCDRDSDALEHCRTVLSSSVQLQQCRFSEITACVSPLVPEGVTGILMDLGVSSHQIDAAYRGFSYSQSGPLDLRMDRESGETAAGLLARVSEGELEYIIREFGEDPQARRIARTIIRGREQEPITSTNRLTDIISKSVPATRIKSLARVFQALRIAVNREMEELDTGLKSAWDLLNPKGRLVVISYHSLEDRRVKRFMKGLCEIPDNPLWPISPIPEQPPARLPIRKAIVPDPSEIQYNPRARSAKLRVLEKLR